MFNLDLSFILTFNIKRGFSVIYGLVIETSYLFDVIY